MLASRMKWNVFTAAANPFHYAGEWKHDGTPFSGCLGNSANSTWLSLHYAILEGTNDGTPFSSYSVILQVLSGSLAVGRSHRQH